MPQTLYRMNQHKLKENSQHTFRSGNHYLILLLTQGSFHIWLKEKKHLCLSSDMLLFKPKQLHTIYISNSLCTILSVSVPVQSLALLSDSTCDLCQKFQFSPHDTAIIHAEIESSMLIKHIASKLYSLKEETLRLGIELYEKSLFTTLLILFLRACVQSDQVYQLHQKKEFMLDEVFRYISHHLTEDLSFKALEKEFFVSGEHIAREFKKRTGMTLHSYILHSRIDLAKKYILQELPVRDVYHRCGFGSYNHFFKVFKKECGMTPMQYYQTVKKHSATFS